MSSNTSVRSLEINAVQSTDSDDCDSADTEIRIHNELENIELVSIHRRSTSTANSPLSTVSVAAASANNASRSNSGSRRSRIRSISAAWRQISSRRSWNRWVFALLVLCAVSAMCVLESYTSIYETTLQNVIRRLKPIFTEDDDYAHEVHGWEWNRTRDIPVYIQPNVNTTLFEPSKLCKTSQPILLLIVVCSATDHFDRRQTIRETWGNSTEFNYARFAAMHADFEGTYLNIDWPSWESYAIVRMYERETNDTNNNYIQKSNRVEPENTVKSNRGVEVDFTVRTVFLVGRTQNNETHAQLINESRLYDDLIQEDFMDTYNNLTIKTLMMLKWVNTNCADKVKFLMKCDDDTFVNVPNLLHYLLGGTVPVYYSTQREISYKASQTLSPDNQLRDYDDLLVGYMYRNVKPINDPNNKWFVPKYMFDGEMFPDYLAGIGYVMTIDTAEKLYNASMDTPLIHIEDVFLTGIVAEKAQIKRHECHLFKYTSYNNLCQVRGMITLHNVDPDELTSAYEFVNNLEHKCAHPDAGIFSTISSFFMRMTT